MTIKVTITNSDSRETAIINVRECQSNPPMRSDTQGPRFELKGGESREMWVHPTQYIVVMEGEAPK